MGQDIFYVLGRDALVLDDHDSGRGHAVPPAWKVSAIRAPSWDMISRLAPSWSASVCTSLNPNDFLLATSMPSGNPTPSSDTASRIRWSSLPRISMQILPLLPPGKAYFKLFETSSLIIKPQGTAVSIVS